MDAKVKKGISIGINVVVGAFLIFAIVMTVLVLVANATRGDGLPSIGGNATVNVLSGSMEPTFSAGDLINVRTDISDEQKQNLEVGDVISFRFDQDGDGIAAEVNTHRIVEVISGEGIRTRYVTKGDNNETNPNPDDSLVDWEEVLGVYESESLGIKGSRVTGCGSVLSFFQTPVGFMVFVIVPLAAFLIYEVVNIVLVIVKLRAEKAGELRAMSEEEIKKRAIEEYLREQAEKKAAEASAAAFEAPAPDPFEEGPAAREEAATPVKKPAARKAGGGKTKKSEPTKQSDDKKED